MIEKYTKEYEGFLTDEVQAEIDRYSKALHKHEPVIFDGKKCFISSLSVDFKAHPFVSYRVELTGTA